MESDCWFKPQTERRTPGVGNGSRGEGNWTGGRETGRRSGKDGWCPPRRRGSNGSTIAAKQWLRIRLQLSVIPGQESIRKRSSDCVCWVGWDGEMAHVPLRSDAAMDVWYAASRLGNLSSPHSNGFSMVSFWRSFLPVPIQMGRSHVNIDKNNWRARY